MISIGVPFELSSPRLWVSRQRPSYTTLCGSKPKPHISRTGSPFSVEIEDEPNQLHMSHLGSQPYFDHKKLSSRWTKKESGQSGLESVHVDRFLCDSDSTPRHLAFRIVQSIDEESAIHQLEAAMYEVVASTSEHLQPLMRNHTDTASPAYTEPVMTDAQLATLRPSQSLDQLGLMYQHHYQREKAFRQSRSHAFLLLMAVGNLAIVYSEWFCYFLLILNHMRSSTILSLPYPLTVFLWGMLSVPRPTKTFWIFLITYTEVIIVIKYIFQFKFIYFNDPMEKPSVSAEALWLPRLFGIDKNDHYALFDLIQLISLFLHRGYLKNNGLWRDHTEFAQDLELVVEENRAAQMRRASRHAGERSKRSSKTNPPSRISSDSSSQGVFNGANSNNQLLATGQPLSGNPRMASVGKSWNPFAKLHRFYLKMTDPRYNKKVDVYIYMFLCEFISFWIMIFGYVSFGPSTGMGDNAFEFIKSNRIPLPFISMLLVQFIFIITDRGLFLQKQVLGKFIFQIIHVLLIHGWLSFILPHITRSYLIIPFLYELRNVMDWMWTHSALSLYHWMELEDIYAKIFVLKCWRRSEIAYPTPRGVNRPAGKKALVGGLLLLFFFLCFWGPMALSSFIGATFDFNPPVLCTFSISFGGFPQTFGFLSNFEAKDVRYITIDGFSGNIWAITPPSHRTLRAKLADSKSDLLLHFHMQCRRYVTAFAIHVIIQLVFYLIKVCRNFQCLPNSRNVLGVVG
ncbi:unnamed protein product [Echinostoma caproni]|uniref:Piezo_RRas_bdg domain-containing protein n=1 Tax=Echinostoma caproni TaxID=27848 RepID=A0A183AU97_9TREM|nr:unnamed protein product [Echinostoma caproni]